MWGEAEQVLARELCAQEQARGRSARESSPFRAQTPMNLLQDLLTGADAQQRTSTLSQSKSPRRLARRAPERPVRMRGGTVAAIPDPGNADLLVYLGRRWTPDRWLPREWGWGRENQCVG